MALAPTLDAAVKIVVVCFVTVISWSCGEPTNNGEPLLNITAGKGDLGIQITNREQSSISDCTVTLLDQGDATWVATLKGPFVRSETVRINWSQFKDNGQPMPSSIGISRSRLIAECFVEGPAVRRSGGLSF